MQIRPRQNYPRIFNGFTSGAFLVWLGNFLRQGSMQDSHPPASPTAILKLSCRSPESWRQLM